MQIVFIVVLFLGGIAGDPAGAAQRKTCLRVHSNHGRWKSFSVLLYSRVVLRAPRGARHSRKKCRRQRALTTARWGLIAHWRSWLMPLHKKATMQRLPLWQKFWRGLGTNPKILAEMLRSARPIAPCLMKWINRWTGLSACF